MVVTFIQVLLGVGAYYVRLDAAQNPVAMVIVTVAHVAIGALTLASSVALAIQIRRHVREGQQTHAVTA
jgi:hypothetical protein